MNLGKEVIETNLLARSLFVLNATDNNFVINENEISLFDSFFYNRHTGVLKTLWNFSIEGNDVIPNKSENISEYNLKNPIDFIKAIDIIDAFNIDNIKQWKSFIEYFSDVNYLSWYTDLHSFHMKPDLESRKKYFKTLLNFKDVPFNKLYDSFSFMGDDDYNILLNDSIENNFRQSHKVNMSKLCHSIKDSYQYFGDYNGASILKSKSLELFLLLSYEFNLEPIDLFKEIFSNNSDFKQYYGSNINDRQMDKIFKSVIKGEILLPEFFTISPCRYDFSAIFAFTNNSVQDVSFKVKDINKLDFIQNIIDLNNDMKYSNSLNIKKGF